MQARTFRTTRKLTSATVFIQIRFTQVLQIIIQKKTAGERLIVANDLDGSTQSTEDVLMFPFYGSSSIPFDITLYVAKESAGDDDDILINGIMVSPGAGTGGN